MIRIGNTDVRRRIGRDIGDDIVIDPAVIGIQAHLDLDVRIKILEIFDGFLVDAGLYFVRIVLRPEDHFVLAAGIKALRDREGTGILGSMAARQRSAHDQERKQSHEFHLFFHPLMPPLDTPAMIFLWKTRKSTISGTEITTTAAIIAGMFSRPKPFSRISWIPLETR